MNDEDSNVNGEVHLLDVVALTEGLPERGLVRGQVGTVVELLAPDVFEVEFSDDNGQAYAFASIPGPKLLVLHHRPVKAAS